MELGILLTQEAIEQVLRDAGLRFLTDQDGDVCVRFGPDGKRTFSLNLWLMRGGTQRNVLALRAWSDERVPTERWGVAMHACNDWNRTHRWPKALVSVHGDTASVDLEYDFPVGSGVTARTLKDWINAFILGADTFWKWALEDNRI